MNPFKTDLFDANNKMNALEIFTKRVFYDGFALSEDGTVVLDIDETKDLNFAETRLHGKIDDARNVIIPSPSKLRTVQNTNGRIFLLDFVADALEDLQAAVESSMAQGSLWSEDPIFKEFKNIDSGLSDSQKSYVEYQKIIKNLFIAYYGKLPPDSRPNLNNFESFSEIFLNFSKTIKSYFPITQHSYLLSNFVSNQCSGLIVSLSGLDQSDDKDKVKIYYDSSSFAHYKDAAIQYGFLIDKNAPWRLIADIENPVMQEYIKSRMGSSEFKRGTFFSTYYMNPPGEISNLKNLMSDLYFAVSHSDPIARNVSLDKRGCIVVERERVIPMTRRDIEASLKPEAWSYLYLKLRNFESGLGYNDKELRNMAKNVSDLKKTLDTGSYMGYINTRFYSISASEGSFEFQRAAESGLKNISKAARIKNRTIY